MIVQHLRSGKALNITEIIGNLSKIQSDLQNIQVDHQKTIDRNLHIFKIMATVKNDLEKTLKKPESLKEVVYNCINMLRAETPYFSAMEGVTKIDPPLTDEQKTL